MSLLAAVSYPHDPPPDPPEEASRMDISAISSSSASTAQTGSGFKTASPHIDLEFYHAGLREIGRDGIWYLSSAKGGNGIEQLRDSNTETFWQSDGLLPHLVNVAFPRKASITEIHIYMSYKVDESYTPSLISVRVGNAVEDLSEIQTFELKEPEGWVVLPLTRAAAERYRLHEPDKNADQEELETYWNLHSRGTGMPPPTANGVVARDPSVVEEVRAFHLQIALLANHQNGRDTHVRQIRIFSPRSSVLPPVLSNLCPVGPQTVDLLQFACIR
ncbi:unnamed protein product [Amoebophrya sp. A25]|nr:unnamed protein product [Amoebophrya sp. A25]|eukprot:GSA25T00013496001.1